MIDCLFVGHNDPDFGGYVEGLREFGPDSPIYRDLRLSFLIRDGKPTTFPMLYNDLRGESSPFGICSILSPAVVYLSSYVARRGFTFDWVNDFQTQKDALAEKLEGGTIRVVAITTTYYMAPTPVIEIVEFVRRHSRRCRVVVGGPYIYSVFVSKSYRGIFRAIGADYYVVSQQGEATLVKLLRAIKEGASARGIPNVGYRSGNTFSLDAVEPEVTDLEKDPAEWRHFAHQLGPVASIRTAVSCPFSCSFCGFPTRGGKYLTSSVANLERELDELRDLGTVEAIQFIDDTFNVPPERFKAIMRLMIRNRYGFAWNCQYRCQYGDRETVELMKASGCEGVFLGIEAANNIVLANMNKHVTVEDYYRGLDLLNEFEIPSHANFIIGFPGETDKSYQDIKTFLAEARPTYYRAQLWYCDPTTPIWQDRKRYGVSGRGFQWAHFTMDAKEAQAKVQELFITWNDTPWTPQYNFEFYGVCQLRHDGLSLPQIRAAIQAFNEGVRQQLRGSDAAPAVIEAVRAAVREPHIVEAGGVASGAVSPLWRPADEDVPPSADKHDEGVTNGRTCSNAGSSSIP